MAKDYYKIDSNIMLTSWKRGKHPDNKITRTLEKMEIGQSFLIPTSDITKPNALISGLRNYAKQLKIRISIRRVEAGMRVWKIKLK